MDSEDLIFLLVVQHKSFVELPVMSIRYVLRQQE